MPTKFGRTRLKPFVIRPVVLGALVSSIVGLANAQTASQPNSVPTTSSGQNSGAVTLYSPGANRDNSNRTRSPIKHVILLIGENRTFDHVYATYTPPHGQKVNNLLSEGIVNADGTPGPNVAKAQQWQASQPGDFSLSPTRTSAYTNLPLINTGGAPTQAYLSSVAQAQSIEPGLPTA